MMNISQLQTMDSQDLISLTKLLLAIALSDGHAHDAEVALIQGFYDDCADGQGMPAFSEVRASARAANADTVLTQVNFANDEINDVALSMMVMTALADGHVSPEEQQAISTAATSLGLTDAAVATRIDAVKDSMLSELSHLPDTASVVDVSRELNQS